MGNRDTNPPISWNEGNVNGNGLINAEHQMYVKGSRARKHTNMELLCVMPVFVLEHRQTPRWVIR